MKASNLLNMAVKHKIFGDGTVTEIEDKYITVQFASKKSKFNFPDAFEKFLSAKDELVQASVLEVITAEKKAAEEQQRVEEATHKMAEERHVLERATPSATRKNVEAGFGPDYNVKHLARQPILTYQQVEEQFGIQIAGFGRGINRTPLTVILISSIDKKKTGFVYHDHWTADGDYMYSGEGKNGDQKLTTGNKAIIDAQRDGKCIHLFVKFSPKEYYYQGVFSLVDYVYEDEKDELGNIRKEYKFRLRKQYIRD